MFVIGCVSVSSSFCDTTNSAEVVIRKGTFIINLEDLPNFGLGAGYGWQINTNTCDGLKFKKKWLENLQPTRPTDGSANIFHFEFDIIKPSSGIVELHYVRPWEKSVAPKKVFKLNVKILPNNL